MVKPLTRVSVLILPSVVWLSATITSVMVPTTRLVTMWMHCLTPNWAGSILRLGTSDLTSLCSMVVSLDHSSITSRRPRTSCSMYHCLLPLVWAASRETSVIPRTKDSNWRWTVLFLTTRTAGLGKQASTFMPTATSWPSWRVLSRLFWLMEPFRRSAMWLTAGSWVIPLTWFTTMSMMVFGIKRMFTKWHSLMVLRLPI